MPIPTPNISEYVNMKIADSAGYPIADLAKQVITATRWNELFNLVLVASDYHDEAIDLLAASVLLKSDKTYVDGLDAANVKLTGNQAVAGIKTLSSSPIVPTPTTDMQASTKKYVDDVGALRYTKTELQTSGQAQVHWGNVTSKPTDFEFVINAKEYGLLGNDSVNDSTLLNTLITNVGSTLTDLYFPYGTYKLATNVSVPSNIRLIFALGATLKPANGIAITGSNAKIEAGLTQIFDLSLGGTVGGTWNVLEAYPEWFGAIPDGITISTTAIQNVFTHFRNVKFSSVVDGEYVMDDTVTIEPFNNDYGLRGRTIDFNNCSIIATQKSGVSPANLFVFNSSVYPDNLRHTTVKNCYFQGTVTGAFIKVKASLMYNCKFENIGSYFGSYADSVIEFNSHYVGTGNSGLNTVKNISNPSTHVKFTLKFTVESGADSQFDDYVIEQITGAWTDDNGGSTIRFNAGAYLMYSNLKVIQFSGKGSVISGGSNTYMYDCNIENIYGELQSATGIGISTVGLQRCNIENIHLKYDPTVTTTAYCVYASASNCRFNNLIQTSNVGAEQSTVYIETFTGDGNVYENIGTGSPTAKIKMDDATYKNTVSGYYGDPFIYASAGTLKSYTGGATATNETLLTLRQNEVAQNEILRCKIRGNTTASANNRFTIKIYGTGVDYTIFTYDVNTASQFEVDIDILNLTSTTFMFFSKGLIDGTLRSYNHKGTLDLASLTIPTDLKLVIDVTNSANIYVTSIDCIRVKAVDKPV